MVTYCMLGHIINNGTSQYIIGARCWLGMLIEPVAVCADGHLRLQEPLDYATLFALAVLAVVLL